MKKKHLGSNKDGVDMMKDKWIEQAVKKRFISDILFYEISNYED